MDAPLAFAPPLSTHDEPLDPKVWKIAAVVYLGPFMSQLDATLVNVSLPTIQKDLHSTLSGAHWVISAYLLALALSLPLAGFLVDRFGAKQMFLACFASFGAASLLCGLSTSLSMLVAARILQGAAGGLMIPMTQMMMAKAAGSHMARVMGYSAVPTLAAPILGPTIAAGILRVGVWPWLFYLNVPVGIFAVAMAAHLLPNDKPAAAPRAFDIYGFALLVPGLAMLLYGLEEASRGGATAYLALGLGLCLVFLRHARRAGQKALVNIDLFHVSVFARSAVTQFFSNAQIFSAQFLIPFYLGTACHLTPSQIGWMLAPTGLGLMCSFPCMGYLTERYGCRRISMTGAALAMIATLPLLTMACSSFHAPVAAVALFLRGLGQGAIGIPSVSAAYASVPKDRLPMATTAMNIVQRLGGPIATTALSIVLASSVSGISSGLSEASQPFSIAFAVLVALHMCSMLAASRLPDRI